MEKKRIIIGIKNVLLLIASFILIAVTYPFYVIYIFGKALYDRDEFQYFYDSFWGMLVGLGNYSDAKLRIRFLNNKSERLQEYMEAVKKASDDADSADAKAYAMLDVINKYNKEFNKE